MSALISVIVPVHNTENYLQDCLKSISAQTYPCFECLLIDDGSTDRSGEICDSYCRLDSRFLVIHQKNQGASIARNVGLDMAKGDYIQFVDSDDSLSPDALKTAWKLLSSGPYDWVAFGYEREGLPDESHLKKEGFSDYGILDGREAMYELLTKRDSAGMVVWNKLYTKTIIGTTRFIDVPLSEDTLFNFQIYRRTRQCIKTNRHLYYWRRRADSLTSDNSPERYLNHFKSMLLLEEFSVGDNLLTRGLCLQKLFRQLLITQFHLTGTSRYQEFLVLAKKVKEKTRKEYLFHKCIPTTEKMRYLLLGAFPRISRTLFKIIGN